MEGHPGNHAGHIIDKHDMQVEAMQQATTSMQTLSAAKVT